jgi:hypothetical protein
MKIFGGRKVQLHAFITSVLEGSEWSASPSRRFTPGMSKRLVESQNQSWSCGKETFFLLPAGNWTPAAQPVARCHTDWVPSQHEVSSQSSHTVSILCTEGTESIESNVLHTLFFDDGSSYYLPIFFWVVQVACFLEVSQPIFHIICQLSSYLSLFDRHSSKSYN